MTKPPRESFARTGRRSGVLNWTTAVSAVSAIAAAAISLIIGLGANILTNTDFGNVAAPAWISALALLAATLGVTLAILAADRSRRSRREAAQHFAVAESLLEQTIATSRDRDAELLEGLRQLRELAQSSDVGSESLVSAIDRASVLLGWSALEGKMRSAVGSETGDEMFGRPLGRLIRQFGESQVLSEEQLDALSRAGNVRNKLAHGESASTGEVAIAIQTIYGFLFGRDGRAVV